MKDKIVAVLKPHEDYAGINWGRKITIIKENYDKNIGESIQEIFRIGGDVLAISADRVEITSATVPPAQTVPTIVAILTPELIEKVTEVCSGIDKKGSNT